MIDVFGNDVPEGCEEYASAIEALLDDVYEAGAESDRELRHQIQRRACARLAHIIDLQELDYELFDATHPEAEDRP